MRINVPFFRQEHEHTCGPACLRMLLALHGKNLTESELSQSSNTSLTHGTRRDALVRTAKQHGFDVTSSSKGTWRDAVSLLKKGIPVLVNYREPTDDQGHYAIVIGFDELSVTFNDPWNGEQFSLPLKSFTCRWLGHSTRDPKWGWMMTLQPRKKLSRPQPPPKTAAMRMAISSLRICHQDVL